MKLQQIIHDIKWIFRNKFGRLYKAQFIVGKWTSEWKERTTKESLRYGIAYVATTLMLVIGLWNGISLTIEKSNLMYSQINTNELRLELMEKRTNGIFNAVWAKSNGYSY